VRRAGLLAFVLAAVAACASGPTVPVRSPSPSALQVRCAAGDAPMTEPQLGWAFCYPATWVAHERDESTTDPKGLDATFDITETSNGANRGLFGFMIIGTEDRAGAQDLQSWVAAHVGPDVKLRPIEWGNALEAGQDASTGKRYALTPHQVIVLELRSGAGNLDLEAAMSARLGTWRFVY
jgi:hypothetical protein